MTGRVLGAEPTSNATGIEILMSVAKFSPKHHTPLSSAEGSQMVHGLEVVV